MNRHLALSLLSAAAGIAAGWLAGASMPSTNKASTQPNAGKVRVSDRVRTATSDAAVPLDFTSYVKRVAKPAEKEEAEQAAARMSNAELREMLLQLPEIDWEAGVSKRDYALYRAGEALAAELFRREGMAAIEWVAATGKKPAYAALLKALCAADPKAAKDPLFTYNTTFSHSRSYSGWEFPNAGVHAAALRGAADLLEAQKLWDSSGLEYIPAFAPDFDFAEFYAKVDQSRLPITPLVAWVGRDPEAAAAAIAQGLKNGQGWESALGKVVESRALMAGEAEAARWVAPLIQAASGHTRDMALSSLAQDTSSARAAALIPALPEDRDRIQLVLGAIRGDFNGGTTSVRVLQALPSEELQVQALTEALSGRDQRSWLRTRQGRLDYLDKIAPKLGLSAAAKQRLLAAIPAE